MKTRRYMRLTTHRRNIARKLQIHSPADLTIYVIVNNLADISSVLNRRLRVFRKVTKTKKSLVTTFLTPNGLLSNVYARRIVREVTGDRLFE